MIIFLHRREFVYCAVAGYLPNAIVLAIIYGDQWSVPILAPALFFIADLALLCAIATFVATLRNVSVVEAMEDVEPVGFEGSSTLDLRDDLAFLRYPPPHHPPPAGGET
ncbi:hypothetical protein GGS26DRAFT_603427 [Hypomontagnella submonticulosa]|nr:hypothetical protein GGS26DRAFT_603427 [Hypomontagnella submonticulosa]